MKKSNIFKFTFFVIILTMSFYQCAFCKTQQSTNNKTRKKSKNRKYEINNSNLNEFGMADKYKTGSMIYAF